MTDRPAQRYGAVALRLGFYVLLVVVGLTLFSWLLAAAGGYFVTSALGVFLAALTANALSLQVYERVPLTAVGLQWNRCSRANLLYGLAGGAGAACLVLGAPLLLGLAQLRPLPGAEANLRALLFVMLVLVLGAIGEEMLFRGYAFQVLVASIGPYATVLPAGLLFGLAHASNLGITPLGLINTAAWGVLLGWGFLRSRDLWLPIGLHLGWNWVLPLFGVQLSGFTIQVTGLAFEWKIGPVWSGGDYGPEGGLLTSAVIVLLFVFLWKAPIRRQASVLAPVAGGDSPC
jgi:membrane protease YdiL (CAAX protease family)